ncbi:MAG: glycosyltransferase family 2 protein [Treponematales bacterium]
MKCAAIVVTYNGKKWYDRCLGSLSRSNVPLEIIVVDNNSADDTIDYIAKNYPHVKLIAGETNSGFARANNTGLRYAYKNGFDYYFLLNQDAWIEPDTVEKLVQCAESNSGYGILSPVHLTADKNHFDRGFINYFHNSKTLHAYESRYLGKPEPLCYDSGFVNAAAWLLSRRCIEIVGGFDTSMFRHYAEDGNYCNRVLFHNLKIGIVISATMCHDREHRIDTPFSVKLWYAEFYANILHGKRIYAKRFLKLLAGIFYIKTTKRALCELLFVLVNMRKILRSRGINKKPYGGLVYLNLIPPPAAGA